MANNKQKAQIHILKDQLGLDRQSYEGMLAPFGVNSSADPNFTLAQADDLIATMRRMKNGNPPGPLHQGGGNPRKGDHGWGKQKYEHLRPRPGGMADPRQLRKIEAMWRDLARDPSDAALANFLERQTGIRNIIWLKKKHAVAMICAEDAMKNFEPKKSKKKHG